MTVKELIDVLSNEDPYMEVVVSGYEDGYDSIGTVRKRYVIEDPNPRSYYGKYMECKNSNGKTVLLLPR